MFSITKEENLSYDNLYNLYVVKQMTTRELAKLFKYSRETISVKMKEYGINKNTQLEHFKLDILQYDLIIGNLLGDGSLWYEGGNYKFRNRHAENQKEYCQFKLNMLAEFCKTKTLGISDGNKKTSNNAQLMYYFNTRALPCFNKFGEMSTLDIIRNLNINSFVIWLMDDGSLSKKNNCMTYSLSVKRFNEAEMSEIKLFLTNILNLKFNITNYKNNTYNQSAIYFPVSETDKIKDIIINSDFGDAIQETMSYKLP